MSSIRSKLFALFARLFFKKRFCRSGDIAKERKLMDSLSRFSGGSRAVGEVVSFGGVTGEWQRPATTAGARVVLYLHSGGFVFKAPEMQRDLAGRIADAAAADVFMLDYRLAPEHRFPAALEDSIAAYKGLIDKGISPDRLVVAGDSSGGNLTVGTLLAARQQGLPLPSAAVCMSPVLDLTFNGRTFYTKAIADPMVTPVAVRWMVEQYLNGHDATDPRASPLLADLTGLPPLLLQAGSEEILLDDSVRMHAAAKAAGVDSILEVWDGQMHIWQSNAKFLPEARKAIESIAQFVISRTC